MIFAYLFRTLYKVLSKKLGQICFLEFVANL